MSKRPLQERSDTFETEEANSFTFFQETYQRIIRVDIRWPDVVSPGNYLEFRLAHFEAKILAFFCLKLVTNIFHIRFAPTKYFSTF